MRFEIMQRAKRKICVVTGSRAEYGILYWLLREIQADSKLKLQVAVTGMHLEPPFGNTYKQIEKDGFKIDIKVPLGISGDSDKAIACASGKAVAGFGEAFSRLNPDIVVVLGDRFEICAASFAAVLSRVPVAHIHGGEITQGAFDDMLRHAVTKMAHFHFVSHPAYAKRVVQMGESPKRVFHVGAPGLDHLRHTKLLTLKELEAALGIAVTKNTAVVTFHPTTLEKGAAKRQSENLLRAIQQSGIHAVFTLPNADPENRVIANLIKAYVRGNPTKAQAYASLGTVKYLSLLKHAGLMVGNSSSGIIEAPSFKLPVVNIGTRQLGRIRAKNVIDCGEDSSSILQAIRKASSERFLNSLKNLQNPFGDGRSSARIKNILKRVNISKLSKGFYDLPQ